MRTCWRQRPGTCEQHGAQATAVAAAVAEQGYVIGAGYGELRDTTNRMESEYIIIGTLASFAYALAIGWMSVAWVDVVRAGAGLD